MTPVASNSGSRNHEGDAEEVAVQHEPEASIALPGALEPGAVDFRTANEGGEGLVRAFELRDYRRGKFAETRDHTERVSHLALGLAGSVAPHLLEDPRFEYGCRLHDIGMLAVSDSVLLKRTALTPAQLDEIREHPLLGERIIASVPGLNDVARQVIGSHHERW